MYTAERSLPTSSPRLSLLLLAQLFSLIIIQLIPPLMLRSLCATLLVSMLRSSLESVYSGRRFWQVPFYQFLPPMGFARLLDLSVVSRVPSRKLLSSNPYSRG